MPIRIPVLALAAVAATWALSGCITGERPTLVSNPLEQIDDESIAAVLERLEGAESDTFTATYDIIPSTTGLPTHATVRVDGGRRRITIGNVDYVSDGNVTRTCENNTAGCVDFLDDARVSDLNITHEFWGDSFAARLRLDASRRVGFSAGRTATIAGQPAACVDVPLPGLRDVSATVTYCALDAGPLARYFGADVSIELTSYEPDVDDLTT